MFRSAISTSDRFDSSAQAESVNQILRLLSRSHFLLSDLDRIVDAKIADELLLLIVNDIGGSPVMSRLADDPELTKNLFCESIRNWLHSFLSISGFKIRLGHL
jgi:hypothetical protein